MLKKGDVIIFEDGHRCMVVENKVEKAKWENEEYKMWDESRTLLVNLDTGDVALHYRDSIPYENGMPYIPIWGGVAKIVSFDNFLLL